MNVSSHWNSLLRITVLENVAYGLIAYYKLNLTNQSLIYCSLADQSDLNFLFAVGSLCVTVDISQPQFFKFLKLEP